MHFAVSADQERLLLAAGDEGGAYPLSHAVLGGRHMHEDYYVVYVTAAEVRDVADELQRVEKVWLRRRFDAIDDPEYRGSLDDDDFEYTWEIFVEVRGLFERAAEAGRAAIFTAT